MIQIFTFLGAKEFSQIERENKFTGEDVWTVPYCKI